MPVQPAYTALNVLTGQARAFTQVYNAGSPPALPANTVAVGGAWPAPWQPIGATVKGVTFIFKRTVNDINIEESQVAVDFRTTKAEFQFDAELSEDTFQTIQLAYGGGTITTVPAASGQPGYQTFVPAGEVTKYSFAFEADNSFGFARRVMIPIVVAIADAKTDYHRADKQRTYNVSVRSLVDIGQCTFREINAAALP